MCVSLCALLAEDTASRGCVLSQGDWCKGKGTGTGSTSFVKVTHAGSWYAGGGDCFAGPGRAGIRAAAVHAGQGAFPVRK